MRKIAFSKREEELMDFMWKYGEPLTAMEILEKCEEHSWSDHYLRVMLRSLERKGVIAFDSLEQRRSQYARRFRTTISREEYYVKLAEEGGVNADLFAKTAVVALMRGSASEDKEELLKKLEEIIVDFKAEDDKTWG